MIAAWLVALVVGLSLGLELVEDGFVLGELSLDGREGLAECAADCRPRSVQGGEILGLALSELDVGVGPAFVVDPVRREHLSLAVGELRPLQTMDKA